MEPKFEVNDGNAIIRGHIAAATGTFSGTFRADNVNAVSAINIRDGSVSSYYTFNPAQGKDVSFTVPAQSQNFQLRLHIPVEIFHWPLYFRQYLGGSGTTYMNGYKSNHNVTLRLQRNGAVIYEQSPQEVCGRVSDLELVDNNNNVEWYIDQYRQSQRRILTLIDDAIDTSVSNTFRFRELSTKGYGSCTVKDSIVAEFRKR
jgi:hypothetical protein